MKAQLEKPVFDCPHPRELARFYAELLGMQVLEDSPEWVVIGRQPGMRELAFQLADPWVPPRWPDPNHPLVHLDIRVDDVDAAEQAVVAAGATRAPGTPETGYRVFRDPVGHPFCLTYGPSRRQDPPDGLPHHRMTQPHSGQRPSGADHDVAVDAGAAVGAVSPSSRDRSSASHQSQPQASTARRVAFGRS